LILGIRNSCVVLSYREISDASGIATIFPRDKYRLGSPRKKE
jgi:hypothetical protein